MSQESFDIVVGVHSIAEALKNQERVHTTLYCTEEGLQELISKTGVEKKLIPMDKLKKLAPHDLQETAKKYFMQLEMEFHRVPSGVFLITTPVECFDLSWVYTQLEKYKKIPQKKILKLLALDQITDVHNGAAIMRTAAFYGVDAIIISNKGNFGSGPNFNRISSGALEHVAIVKCASLSRALLKLKDLNIPCVGLSEHATLSEFSQLDDKAQTVGALCLVLGAEDVGLSHAVKRIVDNLMSIESQGKIKSLNVSVAAAIAMEKVFGKD